MTSICTSHIPCSLSSTSVHFSSSPPATPRHTSRSKNNYRREFVMSSPPNFQSRTYNSITPLACRLTKTFTTPSSGGRKDCVSTRTTPTSRGSRSNVKFSARQIKPNPLVSPRGSNLYDEERATRRMLFLHRVKEAGEEKRWRERCGGFAKGEEEALRALWVAEKRRWQEQWQKEASGQVFLEEYDVFEEVQGNDQDTIRPEDYIFEEDLNSIQDPDQTNISTPTKNQNIYNDDEDDEYDDIFMEVIQQENRTLNFSVGYDEREEHHDEMDMS